MSDHLDRLSPKSKKKTRVRNLAGGILLQHVEERTPKLLESSRCGRAGLVQQGLTEDAQARFVWLPKRYEATRSSQASGAS
jgi:hypothetical protein